MLLLNHETSNTTSDRVVPSKDSKYYIAIVGTLDSAQVDIKRYVKDADGNDIEIEQDPNLTFTNTSELIEIGFPRGTSLEAVVTNAGSSTDVTVFLGE